jgi:hypothetical protein
MTHTVRIQQASFESLKSSFQKGALAAVFFEILGKSFSASFESPCGAKM